MQEQLPTPSHESDQEPNRDLKEIENRIDIFLDYWQNESGENVAMLEKLEHIHSTIDLVDLLEVSDEQKDILRVGAKYHDVGRFWQYKMIGSFDDRIISHLDIGHYYASQLVESGELPDSESTNQVLDMIKYHGIDTTELDLSDASKQNVELMTAVDRIQNSCIGALSYLEREKSEDAKHYACEYQMMNPSASPDSVDTAMKSVSSEVWERYQKGEAFNKNELCASYADYFLFAVTLGIKCLKSDSPAVRDLAQKCYSLKGEDDKSVAESYQDILMANVEEPYATQAVEILNNYIAGQTQEEAI
ncbi:MAG: hypothetical protein ACK5MU_02175 [Candidatus Saccharimonadales bacterium]